MDNGNTLKTASILKIIIQKSVFFTSILKRSFSYQLLIIYLFCSFSIHASDKKDNVSGASRTVSSESFKFHTTRVVSFFKTNYYLPFYYTGHPYNQVYSGHTPDNQKIENREVRFQISFLIPIFSFNNDYDSISAGYTQVSYWQFYNESNFFRENNYSPELFFSHQFNDNWKIITGMIHQSNGKCRTLQRSWNRAYMNLSYRQNNYYVSIKPWILVFKGRSSSLHNPDISDYMGYGDITLGYRVKDHVFTVMERNFKRPAMEMTWNFPVYGNLHGFVTFFSGYGQSLIEYNHHTSSGGIGVALNTGWL